LSLAEQLQIARVLSWTAIATVVGGFVFVAALWPAGANVRRTQQLLIGSWVGGAVSIVLSFVVSAAQATGVSVGQAMSARLLREFAGSTAGAGGVARILLWLFALVVVLQLRQHGEDAARSLGWRVGALAVGFGLSRAVSLGDDHDNWYVTTAAVVHVAGMVMWVGGLVVLCVVLLPRRRADELAAVLPGWARLARTSVGLIVIGGLVLAWGHLGGVSPLFTSPYGRLLIVKLGLVAGMVGAAYLSKTWVEHRLRLAVVLDGDRETVQPLMLSVGLEVAFAVPVLVVAAGLLAGHPPA